MCKSAAKNKEMRLSQEEKAIKVTSDRQVTGNSLKHLPTKSMFDRRTVQGENARDKDLAPKDREEGNKPPNDGGNKLGNRIKGNRTIPVVI